MRLTPRSLFILSILLFIQSYLCQQEQYSRVWNNNTLSSNATLTIDNVFQEDLLTNNSSIIKHSSLINIRRKYTTDEEDYTSTESITFSIRTNQQTIILLTGLTYENINYLFNLENDRLEFIISQDNRSDLILTTKNNSELINNGQWHRLNIERSNRKLRFTLDNIQQSDIELSDGWQVKSNLFIGAELTPTPNGDYHGEISDIIVTNSGRSLDLHEEDNSDENIKDSTQTIISSTKNQTQTIAFLPNDNNEIIYPLPINSSFQTLSFSFRTYSNLSTLIQFEEIYLNISTDGYLILIIQDRQAQKIFSHEQPKPINDGNFYFLEIQLKNQTLEISIDKSKQISIELLSSVLIIKNFIFGLHNQFLGCIENLTYNNQIISFEDLPLNRQQCSSNNIMIKSRNDIPINQFISFKEYDHPLIIRLDHPEEFHIFSFVFSTQESNSIICSLADKAYENIFILSIRNNHLLLTYNTKQIEILMNNSINDGNEHQIVIKKNFLIEFDGQIIIKNMTEMFYINTISFGQLDEVIKEQVSDFNEENFIGCIQNIMLNNRSLMKFNRVENTCQLAKRERKHVISYISSNTSFSIRDHDDIIEIPVLSNNEFDQCQISLTTRSSNGIIISMYSNNDHYSLILFLKNGKLQLKYHLSDNLTSHLIFHDNQIINDGQEHYILISYQISKITSDKNMFIQIDKRDIQISIPLSSPLIFNVIIIGGAHHIISNNQLVACFSNITYNHHPLLPQGIMKSDRFDCFYNQDSICDRQIPCNNIQSLQFCGENDCSLVCTSSLNERNNQGLLEYSSQIKSGEYEQIFITIFTTSGNSTLFLTHNGSTQVSIILENSYPRLIIQNGGIISTYDFPGRIKGDQWHVLQCHKTLDTIDLTFDDETRHYTNLTEYFSLFGNKKIQICGRDFIGYVQDIILMADNHHENLIQNSIHNPGLIDYDPSVTWNNRANIPERKFY